MAQFAEEFRTEEARRMLGMDEIEGAEKAMAGENEDCCACALFGEEEEQQGFANDNRGIGVVEIILILVVLIGLVLLFQTQIKDIVTSALQDISSGADKVGI